MSQRQCDQTFLDTLHSSWTNPDDQQLLSFCNQQPSDVIRRVQEDAKMEYNVTKRKVQEELSPRLDRTNAVNGPAYKTVKKKIDNHASSVATRSRRAYLISSYEGILKRSMETCAHLAHLLRRQREIQREIDAKKDAQIRRMLSRFYQTPAREANNTGACVGRKQSIGFPSSNSLTQHHTWSEDFTSESVPYHTTTPIAPLPEDIESDISPFNVSDSIDTQEQSFEDTDEQASNCTSYLDSIAQQAPEECSQAVEDCLKVDGSDWVSFPIAFLKDAQAQMKADTPNDVLNPAV